MIDKEFIAVFHYDDGGSNRCGAEPYRYAEEIVRCGECKWSKANGTYQWCGRLDSTARITADDFCSYGVNCSEKPNNCEHITEDSVTCARYPACDDCLDNPLNKVKGSERLVKGSERSSE